MASSDYKVAFGEKLQKNIKRFQKLTYLMLLLIVLRLFYLQIIQYSHYRSLAEGNSLRLIPYKAARGFIYDRNKVILATNQPTYSLFLVPADARTHAKSLIRLSEILGEPLSHLESLVSSRWRTRRYEPIRIRTNLDWELMAHIEEARPFLPGAYIQMEPRRFYPYGVQAAHVLGYLGEISESELVRMKDKGYEPGDWIGKKGVEQVYDLWLRGEKGGVQVEVDAMGRQRKILAQKDPVQGNHLILTLDWELQELSEKLMENYSGSLVAVNPENGEILAMVSHPAFDPNAFAGGISYKKWKQLIQDPLFPMQNRCIQGRYPPGSVYKVITALAALEEAGFNPNRPMLCRGIYWFKTWPYRCWRTTGHGWISLNDALVESCDIYFYQLGLFSKIDDLYRVSRMVGLGSKTHIDLDAEDQGLVPNPRWKESTQHMPWFPGNTIQMSIGQGYLLTTPLQMLNAFCMLANDGVVYRPHVLKAIVNSQTERIVYQFKKEVLHQVKWKSEDLYLIKKALLGVVQSSRGTGRKARIQSVRIIGKTGTSENPHGENHAWFVAYAPAENPEVAVAVLVENGGEGGQIAAPIAKRVIEKALGLPVTPWESPFLEEKQ